MQKQRMKPALPLDFFKEEPDHLYPFFQMNMVFDVMDNCDFCQLDPFPWQIKNQEQRQIN